MWGCSVFWFCLLDFFSSQNVAELCLLAGGSRVPGLQSLEVHRHSQDVYAEVILHLLQSLLLFSLPGSSPLKVKAVAENRISGRRNTAISSPLHVPTAAFHPNSFSPSSRWAQVGEAIYYRLLVCHCFRRDFYTSYISLIQLSDLFAHL